MDAKNFTLRMPIDLYQRVTRRKKRSVSEYVIEAVREKLDREREEEVRIGFESLARDFNQEEFDLWASAQRRAMKHVDD